jgi:hypothetical protein
MPRIKGLGALGILRSIKRLLGDEVHRRVVAELPGEIGERARDGTLIAAGWYPLSDYSALHALAQRHTRQGPELARALSRDAVLQDFRGIYSVLTFVLSPQFLVKRSPGIFSRYFDTGRVEVPEARPGFARARFSACTGFDHNLWEDSLGGTLALLEACGAGDLQLTVHSGGGDGDDHLEASTTWK